MFRHQNAVSMHFISRDIHKYWFCASISDILQRQRVPSQNPKLNIFPEFSQLRTFSMWQVQCPPFWKYKICFCMTCFLSLPKITLSSLDYEVRRKYQLSLFIYNIKYTMLLIPSRSLPRNYPGRLSPPPPRELQYKIHYCPTSATPSPGNIRMD